MIKIADINVIEKNLYKLPKEKSHMLLLLHLSVFSDFFLNITSFGDEVEKSLGARVGAKTLAPLSFIILNTIIYNYHEKNAPYHHEIRNMKLPIKEFMNHPLFKFEYSGVSKKFSKNTIECISHNINYPKETIRRQLKPWMKISAVLKDKKIGYYAPFEIIFDTDLFKKSHLWIARKMCKNWSDLLNSLSNLNYVSSSYTINANHLRNLDKNSYFKIWVMLHWYWSLCFRYINNSPINYNECCILSSSLFFNPSKTNEINDASINFYDKKILRPVNLNSIADSTLIPRESVRRIVNSLIEKKVLKKEGNKIYVTKFVTDPRFLITSGDKVLKNMLHDTLVIIVNMFNSE